MTLLTDLDKIKETYFFPPISLMVQQHYSWDDKMSWVTGIEAGSNPEDPKIIDFINAFIDDANTFYEVLQTGSNLEYFIKKYGQDAYDKRIIVSDKIAAIIAADNAAQNSLDDAVSRFESALSEAESIANKHNLEFSISPAYGMGGSYNGEEGEWHASSESC